MFSGSFIFVLFIKRRACVWFNVLSLSLSRHLRKSGKANIRFICSSAWKNLGPTGRIFVKFDILAFF